MERLRDIIQWQTSSGDKLTIGAVTITLQAQALILRWPYGGWVWNRPLAIVVEQEEQTKRVPIVDVSRMVQIGLFSLSLLFSAAIFILSRRRRRR